MAHWAARIYATVAYLAFLLVFLYAVGFLANRVVPKSIDSGEPGSVTTAVAVDLLLLAAFAIQHSVMARPVFKRWWTRWVPAAVERSTYVLATVLVMTALFVLWRPLPTVVWDVDQPTAALLLQGVSYVGWVLAVASTFMIDHFQLFGLRQAFAAHRDGGGMRDAFCTPLLYRYVRHPIMLGFLIAFWATPRMTVGHLLFAGVTTLYVLLAVQLEERDLIATHGDAYREYRSRVPMLIPRPGSGFRADSQV